MGLGGLHANRIAARTRGPLAALVLVAAFATGCGDDSGSEGAEPPSATPSATAGATPSPAATPRAGAPDCADVWADGARIPRRYRGCNGADGFVAKDALSCSSGQFLARHEDRYYGVLGGKVHDSESTLGEHDGYRDAVARCRG